MKLAKRGHDKLSVLNFLLFVSCRETSKCAVLTQHADVAAEQMKLLMCKKTTNTRTNKLRAHRISLFGLLCIASFIHSES